MPRRFLLPGAELRPRSWQFWLPVGFVFLSLLLLVVVPLWINAKTRAIRTEITTVVEPARIAAAHYSAALSQKVSNGRAYAITRDPRFLHAHQEAEGAIEESYAVIEARLHALGPQTIQRYTAVRAAKERWDVLNVEFLSGRMSVADFVGRLGVQQARFNEVLQAQEEFNLALHAEAQARRAEIRRLEDRSALLTVGLVFLALLSALLVVRLALHFCAVSTQSEARRRKVEELMEARARLIRGLGHDLQNPLGAADGYANLLEMGVKGEMTPEQRKFIAHLRRSLHTAQDIIHVLMEFSRAEAGHLQVECQPTDIPRLVGELAEDYRGAAEAAGIRLVYEAAESLDPVEADPGRVRQILGNLLSNAVKYTPGGGHVSVRVGVRSGGKAPGPGNWLVIDVEDNGSGIAPEEHERIFEEFHRVDAGTQAGTGLGLAISRRIARLLGGDLTLRSSPGEGATFSLWLPLECESAPSVAPAA